MPIFATQLQQTCAGAACAYGQLEPAVAAGLLARGISLPAYAAVSLTLRVLAALLALMVGLLFFWRRRDDPSALAMSLLLVTLPQSSLVQYLRGLDPIWTPPLQTLGWVMASCLPAVFYTFPNGRFLPRWTRWLALAWVALIALDNFWPGLLQRYAGEFALGLVFVCFFGSFALPLVVRYRRLSSQSERQQIKWVVFGSAVAMGVFVLFTVGANLAQLPEGVSLLPVVQPLVDFQFTTLLALSVGMAILRRRLWDIDLLINRALVSGETTSLARFASTLLLAALFRPLRARVQAAIDRRFYRRKYNAGQVLARFGALLCDDTFADLDQATSALIGVVADTLQPSHVSLWLLPAGARTTLTLLALAVSGLPPSAVSAQARKARLAYSSPPAPRFRRGVSRSPTPPHPRTAL